MQIFYSDIRVTKMRLYIQTGESSLNPLTPRPANSITRVSWTLARVLKMVVDRIVTTTHVKERLGNVIRLEDHF
jgi:hypothetical protein